MSNDQHRKSITLDYVFRPDGDTDDSYINENDNSYNIEDEKRAFDPFTIPDSLNLVYIKDNAESMRIKYFSKPLLLDNSDDNIVASTYDTEKNSEIIQETTIDWLFLIEKEYVLHKYIFDKDIKSVEMLLEKFKDEPEILERILNLKDHRGNTPLTLCAILRGVEQAKEYLDILLAMMRYPSIDTKIKNVDNWSAIELATSQKDIELVQVIYNYMLMKRKIKIERNKKRGHTFISQINDFYLEMKWEVHVPLLSVFCPHDTCKIWKVGPNVRFDFTFLQFKNLSSIRAPSSFIFSEQGIYHINHKTGLYYSPNEDIEEDEKVLIIDDIMNCNRLDGDFKLKKCDIVESKSSWGNKQIEEKISNWKSKKYEVNITAFVNLHNKETFEYTNIKDYWNIDLPLYKNIVVILDEKQMKQKLANNLKVQDNFKEQILKMGNNKDKKLKAYLWVADDFPISSSQLISLFDSFADANEFTKKIKEFLHNPEVKDITQKGGFPIKLKIPFSFFVDVTVTFTKCTPIQETDKEDLFKIPQKCKKITRKQAQDLLNNPKRRLGYANIH